jgi:hypothetical protein
MQSAHAAHAKESWFVSWRGVCLAYVMPGRQRHLLITISCGYRVFKWFSLLKLPHWVNHERGVRGWALPMPKLKQGQEAVKLPHFTGTASQKAGVLCNP